jgi:hypothetical protein
MALSPDPQLTKVNIIAQTRESQSIDRSDGFSNSHHSFSVVAFMTFLPRPQQKMH